MKYGEVLQSMLLSSMMELPNLILNGNKSERERINEFDKRIKKWTEILDDWRTVHDISERYGTK